MDASSGFLMAAPPRSVHLSFMNPPPHYLQTSTLSSTTPISSCRLYHISCAPTTAYASSLDLVPDFSGNGAITALVVLFAIVVGFSAQGFINSMLDGDRGLGAFLSDGTGYGRSSFKPRSDGSKSEDAPLGGPDPLPWLKLPEFDFVEVAGQGKDVLAEEGQPLGPEEEAEIVARLEELAYLMKVELKAGNTAEAGRIRAQLERTMEEYGFSYEKDES